MSEPGELDGYTEFGRSISGYSISKCLLCKQGINALDRVVWLRNWNSGTTVHESCYDAYRVVTTGREGRNR